MSADLDQSAVDEVAGRLVAALRGEGRAWLFLDYDGTLAEFAPNPDVLLPDPHLIGLLARLARHPRQLRVGILSGRRLSHIETLLPIPGLLLAGTYGLEYISLEGETLYRLDYGTNRPILDQIKPDWAELAARHPGFYLEDKGWSLALHARFADPADAQVVLNAARQVAESAPGRETFSVTGDVRFLEIAPRIADKGQALAMLLDRFHWPGAALFYFGDDEKDEQAFEMVKEHGGLAVLVAGQPRPTRAALRLASPAEARAVLDRLANFLDGPQPFTA